VPNGWESIATMLMAWLVAGALAGVPVLLLRLRNGGHQWFPAAPAWRAEWGGSVVALCFAVTIFAPAVAYGLVRSAGLFDTLYGPGFPIEAPPDRKPSPEETSAATLRGLWASTIAFPISLTIILGILATHTQSIRHFLGLTRRDLARKAFPAWVAWVILTPVAFGVFIAANLLLNELSGRIPDKHPLTQLGEFAREREWILFALQVVVLAPFMEELIFRGVLLPWMIRPELRSGPDRVMSCRDRSLIVCALAISTTVILHLGDIQGAFRERDWFSLAEHLASTLFLVLLLPLFLLLPRWSKLGRSIRLRSLRQGRAVFANAMLFAAVHASVWPSPVPLFVLGLGLGWLAIRSRGILVPFLVHALFNSVSCIYMLMGGE